MSNAQENDPRRALFVHAANELYGADIILLGLLEARDPEKWLPRVVLPNDVPYEGRLSRKLSEIGVGFREMKLAVLRRKYFTPRGLPLYMAYFAYSTAALVRMIRSGRIDVVHSNTTAVIPGAIAARLTRRPHVWHCHEMIVSPRIVRRLTARLAPALSDVVLTVSGAVRDHMLQDSPGASNIRVLHNGIEVQRFAQAGGRDRVRGEFGYSADDVVVGTLARVSRGKGQSYLLEAAARLAQSHPNLRYLLVGDAFTGQEHLVADLRARVEELGLSRVVTIAGYRSDAPDVLAAIDICVLPSTLPDSFPTVILEAMASGKPVVATNWGGATEMVVEGETGFTVPIDRPDVLAEHIGALAGSRDLRVAMGQAGHERAEALFTRERMAREFWTTMESVVRGHG